MKNKCVWFLGLSGSGKSTLSEALSQKLKSMHQQVVILDGDALRNGLNNNLGFSLEDRTENVRRTAEVAKLFLDQGFWVLVALITPLEKMRNSNRQLLKDEYVEVFVDTPLWLCQKRDIKGLYEQVKTKKIKNFTGISSPFELPTRAEVVLKTENSRIESLIDQLLQII